MQLPSTQIIGLLVFLAQFNTADSFVLTTISHSQTRILRLLSICIADNNSFSFFFFSATFTIFLAVADFVADIALLADLFSIVN